MPKPSYLHRDKEFRQAWRAAMKHIKSFDGGEQSWLRTNLDQPLTEHFSFAYGNQLFLVLVETSEYRSNKYRRRLIEMATEMNAIPCIIRMQKIQGKYIPSTPGWGLLHAETLEDVAPDKPATDESLQLSAQERHMIAVNAVVDRLRKDGNRIRSVRAYPPTWPSIRFENYKQECWVIVQSKFDPIPYDIGRLLERDKLKEQDGYLANVDISPRDSMGCSNIEAEPIFRGHEHRAQVTKLEKIYDQQTGECKILDALGREIEWFHRNRLEEFEHKSMCQCGTEDLISRSQDPMRMRAFLLVSIFIDQLLYTHYQEKYPNFAQLYPIPKLLAHSGYGNASPNWFIYSSHGYDQHADWDKINLFAHQAKKIAYQFIQKNSIGSEIGFEKALVREIKGEFEEQHQTKLLDAFEVNITDQASQ